MWERSKLPVCCDGCVAKLNPESIGSAAVDEAGVPMEDDGWLEWWEWWTGETWRESVVRPWVIEGRGPWG